MNAVYYNKRNNSTTDVPQICSICKQEFKNEKGQNAISQAHMIYQKKNELVTHSQGNNFISYPNTTKQEEIRISLSSIKPTTLKVIKEKHPHIICSQEIRGKTIESLPGYSFIQKLGISNHQGGVALGVHSSINFIDITEKIKPLTHEI